jgi:uncharacterized protein (TIGR02266 family)
VVDDSDDIRVALTHTLGVLGMQVQSFASGREALEAMTARPPSLILADLRMEPMPGDELCRKVKENRALTGVPVIIFTAGDSAQDVMRSWRAGADDFLPKPIKVSQLKAKLDALKRGGGGSGLQRKLSEKRRILFVDDSRFYRSVLGGALEHSGFRLLYARSGKEALEVANAHADAIDAVLTDLVMPGMDGLELITELRKKPSFSNKPLLVMSASETESERIKAVERATGYRLLEKRLLPVEAIVTQVNATLQPLVRALRAAERVPFFSVAEFRADETEDFMSGFSYDVSPGGIFVRTLTSLPAGSPVQMRVRFTFQEPPPPSTGQVVWANEYRSRSSFCYPVGMGIRFTYLDPVQAAEVEKLVKMGGRLIAA